MHRIRVVSAFLTTFTILSLAATAGQVSQANPTSSRRVHLILPGEPAFENTLREHFSELVASSRYAAIKATSVIIENDTQFNVKAFALRWSITRGDGARQAIFTSQFADSLTSNLIPGRESVLQSNSFGLASPLAQVEEQGTAIRPARLTRMTDAYADMDPQFSHSTLLRDLMDAKEIEVTIDGIVFGNGVFVGEDRYGLWDKFTCEHNGALDEAAFIRNIMARGDAVQPVLERDIAAGISQLPPDHGCVASRGREASRLLELLQKRGMRQLEEALVLVSKGQHVTLHRLSSAH